MDILFCFASSPVISRTGSLVTRERWQKLLENLGHLVFSSAEYPTDKSYDALVAFHATKSAEAVQACRSLHPKTHIVVCLTGTDLYIDLENNPKTKQSLEHADKIVVLHERAHKDLPLEYRDKTMVIYQSAVAPVKPETKSEEFFDVCVVGHLRQVKDPMRTALAARKLPPSSRIRITHAGGAHDPSFAKLARVEMTENDRYHWLDEISQSETERLISRSHLMSLTSYSEGGANVVTEAIVSGVPVLLSDISCTRGLMGDDYPGFFQVEDTDALTTLLHRAETDRKFYNLLQTFCQRTLPKFSPEREQNALAEMLIS